MKKFILFFAFLLVFAKASNANTIDLQERVKATVASGVRSGDIIRVEPREFYGQVGDRIILNCTDPYDEESGSYPEGTHIGWSWTCSFLEWNVEAGQEKPYFVFDAKGPGEGFLQVYLENENGIAYSDYCYVKITSTSGTNDGGGCNAGWSLLMLCAGVVFLQRKDH